MTQPSNEIEARIAETLEASKSPFNVCPKECKEDIRWLCETLRSSRLEVERKDAAIRWALEHGNPNSKAILHLRAALSPAP